MSRGKRFWRSVGKVIVSNIFGVIFCVLWLVILFKVFQWGGEGLEPILWILAPVLTALGFTIGAALLERDAWKRRQFLRLYIWPLIGCVVGTLAIYWFVPILIVVGMLVVGTLSIILREIIAKPNASAPQAEAAAA